MITAEWIKLRSVRSSRVTALVALCGLPLAAAIALAAAASYDHAPPAARATGRIAELSDVVVAVPQLCLGILGALAFTSEHATGLIRSTLTAVPRRWPVLAAKAAVLAALAVPIGFIVTFGTFFSSRWILGGRFPVTSFADLWPTLITTSLSVVVFALLGLGLGALLRHTAAAVAALVCLVYVLPMVCGNLPSPWRERLGSVMVGALPREITGADLTHSVYGSLLPPVAAAAVLVMYAVVPLLAGVWRLCRTDA
ncbi:MAG: ABC transporter permease subunit [Nonomuraea sp.]|nr:ABC transporter permease subunit [Nonomuraea sp.]